MIKGQNFRLMLTGKCIAGATSCTFEDVTEFEEISTKDSTGLGKDQTPKKNTFNISVDALVLNETDNDGFTLRAFLSAVIAGSPLSFKCTETNGEQNRSALTNPDVTLSGSAMINDLTIKANVEGETQLSAKLIGYGQLSKIYKGSV